MKIQSFKAEGLAQLSYLVSSGQFAFVVDPQLDISTYIDAATSLNVKIDCIFETHRNEDFISGAAALAQRLDIPVYHGPNADENVEYASYTSDGDKFNVGDLLVSVLETPGHTKDSICLAVSDTAISDEVIAVFTGDTLFVNDVGRTDFYPNEEHEMAGRLFESLQKLSRLPESAVIYPAHGAGSVCGGGMADREFSTIGYERRNNPKFSIKDKQRFIEEKVQETHYYAPYFEKMEKCNVKGELCTIDITSPAFIGNFDPFELSNQCYNNEIKIIDVRTKDEFCSTHIDGSLFFGDGLVSSYAGWFLKDNDKIIVVANSGEHASSTVLQLRRIGFNNVIGYIINLPVLTGDANVDKGLCSLSLTSAKAVEEHFDSNSSDWVLLDVRKQDERDSVAIDGATHVYLGHLSSSIGDFDKNLRYTVYCGSGVRATTAASVLRQAGIKTVDVMEGSMKAWQKLS